MISFKEKGNFSKLKKFLKKSQDPIDLNILNRAGQEGVVALKSATPKDSGNTANSWYYETDISNGIARVSFHNSKIQNGVVIAIILQYGHATRNGGWITGTDYINPAVQPIFDRIVNDAWKEVTKG